MSLIKTPKFLLSKSKWFLRKQKVSFKRLIHRKPSSPPMATKNKAKLLEESKGEDDLPMKPEKTQRDIFGATILPQNLSFENSKRLSENQVRLEDIPLVDEDEAAEIIRADKLKTRKVTLQKEEKKPKDFGVAILEDNLAKSTKALRNSMGHLFWVAEPYEEIPGPKILQNVANALKQCARQLTIVSLFRFIKTNTLTPFRTYGPIVKLPEILGGRIVLISKPEHISSVFEQDQRYPVNSTLDSIQRSRTRQVKKDKVGLYLTEEWEDIKKTMGEPVMKESEKYFEEIDEAASKFIRRIKTIRNRQNEVPEDFLFEINKWSLECLCSVIFDKPFGFLDYDSVSWPSKTSQLLYSLTVATKNLCHMETGFQFWRFMNTSSLSSLSSACNILEGIISEYVGQVQIGLIRRLEKSNKGLDNLSFVEKLLLQDDLHPEEIVNNILDTLLIGMNTMSTALGFLFYHISQNPRIQMEVWKEVKSILPEKYSRLEPDQVSSFKYIQACLKESLRLKMPMPVLTRVLSKNVILSNYQIPKGTFVLMTAQVEGVKEENFDNPTQFLPERWLDQENSHPFTSLPMRKYFEDSFEQRIGEASIWVCTSHVIRHFCIEYVYEDIEATSTAISFPNKPLRFTFVDRKQ